ncbi:MAG: hypothetical protein H0U75_12535 [Legionella sp.]|nr:hypothetical protein [Legionella sp.]
MKTKRDMSLELLGDEGMRPSKIARPENKNGLLLLNLAREKNETGLRQLLDSGADIDELITPCQQNNIEDLPVTAFTATSAAALLAMNDKQEAAEFLRTKGGASIHLIAIGAARTQNHAYAEILHKFGALLSNIANAIPLNMVNDENKLILLLATTQSRIYRQRLYKELCEKHSQTLIHFQNANLLNKIEGIIETTSWVSPIDYRVRLIRALIQQYQEVDILQAENMQLIITTSKTFAITPEQALYLLYGKDYSIGINSVDLPLPGSLKGIILSYLVVINIQEQAEVSDKSLLHQKVDEIDQHYINQPGRSTTDNSDITPHFLMTLFNTVVTNSPNLLAHALEYTADHSQSVKNPKCGLSWLSSETSNNLRKQASLVRKVGDSLVNTKSYAALIGGGVKIFFSQSKLMDDAATVLHNKMGPAYNVKTNDDFTLEVSVLSRP